MTITAPEIFKGMEILYPELKREVDYRVEDHLDGKLRLWVNPDKIKNNPTDEQLIAASKMYVEPSKLQGGTREPTSLELSNNSKAGMKYLEDQLHRWTNKVAESWRFTDINSISKYLGNYVGKYSVAAQALSEWVHKVYEQAEDIEASVMSGARKLPTWPELKQSLPQPPDRDQ